MDLQECLARPAPLRPDLEFSRIVRFGRQSAPGVRAPDEAMQTLGANQPLTLADDKVRYDALGSFLHVLTPLQGQPPSAERVRARCDEVVRIAEAVLASSVWGSGLSHTVVLDRCMRVTCHQPIVKRVPLGEQSFDAEYFACGATYRVTTTGRGSEWSAIGETFCCAGTECSATTFLWPQEVVPGTAWVCDGCGRLHKLDLCVLVEEDPEADRGARVQAAK